MSFFQKGGIRLKTKPNLFIVGVAKAGTTTIANYLANHSEVFISEKKEPNYFTREELKTNNLYYGKTYTDSEEEYLNNFNKANNERVIGEASVSYFQFPEAASRIHKYNPQAKIIIILRDRIDRALSHYLMDKRLGLIEHDLNDIIANPEEFRVFYNQYIEQGVYHHRISTYLKVFGSEQVLIIPDCRILDHTYEDILNFIGVDYEPLIQRSYNTSKVPSNRFVARIYKNEKIRKSLNTIVPQTLKHSIQSSQLFKKQEFQLSQKSLDFLNDYYNEDKNAVEAKLMQSNVIS